MIAAWNGPLMLRRCLDTLREQVAAATTEVIVAHNFPFAHGAENERMLNIRFLELPAKTTVPLLRTRGIAASSGAIVALTEDLCFFHPDWLAAVCRAHELDHPAIGGVVDNSAGQTALDWAVYLYDYGRYMPPVPAGAADSLSGANVSYKRSALAGLQADYERGFFETEVHAALQKSGGCLRLEPAMIVHHFKHYKTSRALADARNHGRIYGGRRSEGMSWPARIARGLAAPLLPFLMTLRIAALAARRRGNHPAPPTCLPFLFLVAIFWAWGEGCGYFFGTGKSTAYWR